jgi:hypothetical protein
MRFLEPEIPITARFKIPVYKPDPDAQDGNQEVGPVQ